MVSSIVVAVAAAVVFESARAHSWVRCSDYKGVIAGGDYDEDECEGWIRGWEYEGVTFAKDRGINHQVAVGGGQSLCQSSMTSSSATYGYSDTDKIPRYTSGSSVRVVWPAKNHANYDCFDFIPDTAMKLYWNPEVNPSSDLTNGAATMEEQGYELVKDWHDGCSPGTDGCGFQNCPKFCDDTDAATCFGDFVVPDVDTSGYYTFVWHWIFNPGSPYITCWEAYIEGDGDGDDQPDPAPTTTTNPIDPAPTKQPTANPIAAGTGTDDAIVVMNDESTQNWYLSFTMDHIDATLCSDSVSGVSIYQSNAWRGNDQYYNEGTSSEPVHRYAFQHDGVAFGDMLPISVRIEMASGRTITLWAIIEDLNVDSTFTSDQLICGGTLSPTPPTPEATTASPTAPTVSPTPYPTGSTVCIDEDALEWRSYGNQLMLNGNKFDLKGLSWFGFETGNYNLYGLDVHDMDWYLQWMVDHGFNAVRLPFSKDFMDSGTLNQNLYKDAVRKMGEYGLMVMVDFHSSTAGSWTEGFKDVDQTEAISTWQTVADLLVDEWNVFIADVFNEPHDVTNSEWADWISFCESTADALWAKGVNWMVAVEGTNSDCAVLGCCWGENLEGVRDKAITFDLDTYGANRFVWSPHVYGGDVTGNWQYSQQGWQSHWGYLVDGSTPSNEATSIIGEFGTTYTGSMVDWLDSLVDYLEDIDQRNTFFWCLNPNSGDTGGLLEDDWTTEQTAKLAVLERLQPFPSKLEYDSSSNRVCVQFDGASDSTMNPSSIRTNTPTTNPDPAPTANPIANGDAIVVINDESTQNWYLSFTMDHIDDCLDEIDAVQLDRGDGVYQDHDQYYYSNGHHYAFFHDGSKFDNLLPISLRIQFLDGTHVDLEDIITDLDRNSVFTASTSCDHWQSARSPMMNQQTMNNVDSAKSAFSVDLTAPELCQLLLALSVLFNAVMVTIVCVRMRSGRGPQKYNAVGFDTETEMEDLEQ